MNFEISLDELKMLIRQYKKLITAQELLDQLEQDTNVFARGFHGLLTRLILEQNRRLDIGITERRIKL
jgi:hypothetical protein